MPYLLDGDFRDGTAFEVGQNLLAQVLSVDRQCGGLPMSRVSTEHFLGHRLDSNAVFAGRVGATLPQRRAPSMALAWTRASSKSMAGARPTTLQMRRPSCWLWMK